MTNDTTRRQSRQTWTAALAKAMIRSLPLVPGTLLIVGLFLLPIIWALYSSMTNQTLTGANAQNAQFVGLENYKFLLSDSRTWDAIVRTLLFVGFSVLGQNIGGFILAYLKQSVLKPVRNIVNVIVVTAWVIPEVVVGFLWYTFLRGDTAAINQVLTFFGLPPQDLLTTAPLLAVIVMNIWRGCAFSMLIYSAAIQDVPQEAIEASELDGAGEMRRIISVIIPILKPVIATTFVLTTLNTLGVFGLIWITTGGGPGARSETLSILMYNQAYGFGLIGYGSAIAVLLLGIGVIFAAIYIRISRTGNKT